jgi:hypothetical protein
MKIAYLIIAHKSPQQVVRLISRLRGPGTHFVIHIDKRAAHNVFQTLQAEVGNLPFVHFAKQVPCFWGAFGIVAATIECMRELLNARIDFDYAALLSGQHYPIKSSTYIAHSLQQRAGQEYIESFPLMEPNRWTNNTGPYQAMKRVSEWYLWIRSRHFSIRFPRRFPAGV